ncbi:MAG: hypothetical protein WCJ29_02850 [bacterium]
MKLTLSLSKIDGFTIDYLIDKVCVTEWMLGRPSRTWLTGARTGIEIADEILSEKPELTNGTKEPWEVAGQKNRHAYYKAVTAEVGIEVLFTKDRFEIQSWKKEHGGFSPMDEAGRPCKFSEAIETFGRYIEEAASRSRKAIAKGI